MAAFTRMSGTPPFDMEKPKFDQKTFKGRFFGFCRAFDPRTLFVGGAKIRRSEELLNDYAKTRRLPAGTTDEDMWKARKIVEDAIHPVTKQRKFFLGRQSAYVLTKFPIFFVLIKASTAPEYVITNVLRGSYNAIGGYVNSPPSVDWGQWMKNYFLDVMGSVLPALGAWKAIQVVPALQSLAVGNSYWACSWALFFVTVCNRTDEWCGGGLSLVSAEGKELGKSVKAGRRAVLATVCTRAFACPIPSLLIPAIAVSAVPFSGAAGMVTDGIIILFFTSFGLIFVLCCMPHTGRFSTTGLEPKFQSLTDSSGKPITKVFTKPDWLRMF